MGALNWDSEISNDGSDFKLLEPGTYPAVVKAVEKSFHNGSDKIPPCPKAVVTLRVNGETDVDTNLLLANEMEWKLCAFFTAVGDRKRGEALRMNWDGLVGKKLHVEVANRSWTGSDGKERQSNDIARFIDPADLPAAPAAPAPAQPAAAAPSAW